MGGHQYLPDVLNMSEDLGSHAPGNITFISVSAFLSLLGFQTKLD